MEPLRKSFENIRLW